MLQSIWGPAGLNSCTEMALYKSRLEANIERLADIENRMTSDLSRLESDESRLRQEAYRIGMVGQSEIRIRIPILGHEASPDPGNIAPKPIENGTSQAIITGITLSFGLVLLLLLSLVNFEVELLGGRKKRPNRLSYYHGVRVHTASLE